MEKAASVKRRKHIARCLFISCARAGVPSKGYDTRFEEQSHVSTTSRYM